MRGLVKLRPRDRATEEVRRAQALSRVVKQLPPATLKAMLDSIEHGEELIVGGYTDRRGRMCPMLAVRRCGARADFTDFPRAWDAFAWADRPRPASVREIQILKALLEEAYGEYRSSSPKALPRAPAGDAPATSRPRPVEAEASLTGPRR